MSPETPTTTSSAEAENTSPRRTRQSSCGPFSDTSNIELQPHRIVRQKSCSALSSATSNIELQPRGTTKQKSCTVLSDYFANKAELQRPASSRAAVKPGSSHFSNIRTTATDRVRLREENVFSVFFPWSQYYKAWWGFTVVAAMCTIFVETFLIAFAPAGMSEPKSGIAIVEYILVLIFVIDMGVTFNLAFYDATDEIIYDRRLIAGNYFSFMFWIDLIGIFPFYAIALACAGEVGQDNSLTQYLALLKLARMVRLYRVKQLFDILQYSSKISLLALTLTRNFSFATVWTHCAACTIYFIARQYNFNEEDTFIGHVAASLNVIDRYIVSLYWAVTTFATVGYGDFSPKNTAEQCFGIVYMLVNMACQAYIFGSMTLVIVKKDEKTGQFRDALQKLDHYSTVNSFDKTFKTRLKTAMKLNFATQDFSDEEILQHFPSAVRRKVLRKLYLPPLVRTSLMKGIRQQFVDAFLATCTVETFSPGEELVQRGSVSPDLYLLIEGMVELLPVDTSTVDYKDDCNSYHGMSIADSMHGGRSSKYIYAGDFINEIGFYTESPEIDSLRTVTVCKTLTMSHSAYKLLCEDHPGSCGLILHNLLAKVMDMAADLGSATRVNQLEILRAGSLFDDESSHAAEVQRTVTSVHTDAALTSIQDLIKMHISKQKDDHTTRFLFAASRNDSATITLMCDQGFDPNSADYDSRTALMVAAMKGNTEVVTMLLEDYRCNPNLVDAHGSSALYEAVRNGHETTMDVLLKFNAKLCMSDSLAASMLCQLVFDGDTLTLRRLLRANIQVNAADYDKRTAAHIAAAEGNVAALKVLVKFGADLTAKDRWDNSIDDEAKKAHDGSRLLEYLRSLKTDGAM